MNNITIIVKTSSLLLTLCALLSFQTLFAQCVSPDEAPAVTAFAIQPSCNVDGSTNSDGYLQLSEVIGGGSYEVNIGNTNDGTGTRTSLVGATYPLQILTSLSNPDADQDYTVRVYLDDVGGGACATDVVVSLAVQDCEEGCACKENVYINSPAAGGPVHKFTINDDDTFTEIFSDDASMTPFIAGGRVQLPHGVAVDAFGKVYVGNLDRGATATRGIDKFDCAGNLEQFNAIPNDAAPNNMNGPGGSSLPNGPVGSQTNFFIIDDKMYVNSWVLDGIDGPRVTVYDICSGEQLGFYESCDPVTNQPIVTGDHWGLYVEEETNTAFYNTSSGIVVYDLTQPYGCQDSIIMKEGDGNNNNFGITRLPDGSFVTRNNRFLYRYAADGTLLIGTVDMATIEADEGVGEGGNNSFGLVSTEDGRIYVISGGKECASLYDENLNYIKAAFVVPGGGTSQAKAVAITKECCPNNSNTIINVKRCVAATDSVFFLSDLVPCEGALCITGDAVAATGNTNLMFDPCIGKITIIDPASAVCGTFTMNNTGAGNANRCDAFVITLNLEIDVVVAPVIGDNRMTCSANEPLELIITTPPTGVDQFSYQWLVSMESDSTGFTPIPGATMDSYTPTTSDLSADGAYFALEITNINTVCMSGECRDTSNAVLIPMFTLPVITLPASATICKTEPIDLKVGTSVTPDTLAATWSTPDGAGTFDGGTDFATATTYTPSSADASRGSVTLVLTTDNPDGLCRVVSEMVTFNFLNVGCSTFPWSGN